MKLIRKKRNTGLTLIEIMVAMTVITIAITGAMGFRYYSALDARKADVQITAARLGLLLLESWKGTGGNEDYNPALHLGSNLSLVSNTETMPTTLVSYSTLNRYTVTVNGQKYYFALSHIDATESVPKVLSVNIAWPVGSQTSPDLSNTQLLKLTTYKN